MKNLPALQFVNRLTLMVLILITTVSCSVNLIAPQDTQLISQVDSVAKDIDGFYLKMLEKKDRNYIFFAEDYIKIEVELNSIYMKNKLKAQNAETTQIAKNVRDTWMKYKSEHKSASSLKDGEIIYNNSTMGDFMYTLSVAENAKPK